MIGGFVWDFFKTKLTEHLPFYDEHRNTSQSNYKQKKKISSLPFYESRHLYALKWIDKDVIYKLNY
jgi:hypothetical protein